jgi:hypothetical protein
MTKKLALGLALSLGLSSQVWAAAFVNGGFEDGTFSGWTQNGGTVSTGPIYNPNGTNRNAITNAGTDALTNNVLSTVYSGAHSARVEDSGSGSRYSTLTQKVTGYTDPNIFFAWAAVLNNPGHAANEQPRFSINLTDLTTGSVLYDVTFDVSNPPAAITLRNGVGDWKYTDWIVQNLDVSGLSGHDFALTVTAADCTLGGHGGYAYVDGFGAVTPPAGDLPAPGALGLIGLGGAALLAVRRKKVQA